MIANLVPDQKVCELMLLSKHEFEDEHGSNMVAIGHLIMALFKNTTNIITYWGDYRKFANDETTWIRFWYTNPLNSICSIIVSVVFIALHVLLILPQFTPWRNEVFLPVRDWLPEPADDSEVWKAARAKYPGI